MNASRNPLPKMLKQINKMEMKIAGKNKQCGYVVKVVCPFESIAPTDVKYLELRLTIPRNEYVDSEKITLGIRSTDDVIINPDALGRI